MALALSSKLEAVLFAAGEPLSKKRVAQILDVPHESLEDALNALRITLEDRGVRLIEAGEDIELRSAPEASDAIQALRESELSKDLGRASLETLALVLYKGGATRGEIDWVRGVNSTAAIRALLLRGLVEKQEDPADKRRVRYIATIDALAHLGVASASELPKYEELTRALAEQEARAETSEATP